MTFKTFFIILMLIVIAVFTLITEAFLQTIFEKQSVCTDFTQGTEVYACDINLDGMTTDGNGFLYVIDTWGRIFKVDLEAQTYTVLVSSGLPDWPQDCVYDPFNNRIVIGAYQQAPPIVCVDPESGEVTTLLNSSAGRFDGSPLTNMGIFTSHHT